MGSLARTRLVAASRWLSLALASLVLTGCMVGPNYKVPSAAVAERWLAAQDVRISGDPADPKEWWKVFNDPVLDSLIQSAYKQNITLQMAALRIVEARTGGVLSFWSLFPFFRGSAGYTHSEFSKNVTPDVELVGADGRRFDRGDDSKIREFLKTKLGIGDKQVLNRLLPKIEMSPGVDRYSATFDLFWSPDIWGGKRRAMQAAAATVAAEFANYDDALVALVAEVASTYVRIRAYDEALGVLRENIALQEKLLKGAQERVGKNGATEADVHLATVLLRDTQAKVPQVETALRASENALCILLGKVPGDIRAELGAARPIPVAPAKVAVGVPTDLLRRRPDVRRAERQAAAACARIGVATDKLYPPLNLFGFFGFASSNTSNLFDSASQTSTYGAGTAFNFLYYPALIELIRDADAQYQVTILAYRESILQAAQEAEDAATRFAKSHDRLQILTEGVNASKRAAEVSTAKYQDGSVAFPMPLESLRYLESEQNQMIETRGSVALSLIALYKALGGGWQIRQNEDLLSAENRKQMRSRTDWWSFFGYHDLNTKRE